MSHTDVRDLGLTAPTVREELLASARRIGDEWGPAELDVWRDGRLPEAMVQDAARAGLYSMTLPADVGGTQVDLLTMIDVVAELTERLPPLGWNVMIAQGCGFLGWGGPAIAEAALRSSPRPIIACALAATGTGSEERDAGGDVRYRISGRWLINSGCQNAEWFIAAFGIESEDGTERHWGQDGVRFALVPMSSVVIEQTWDVLGLRGTGSHDVLMDEVVVPHAHTINPFHEESPRDATLYHVSYFNYLMAMMAGPVIGLGRRAVSAARSVLAGDSGQVSAPDALVLYRADNARRAAEAGTRAAVTTMWSEVAERGAASLSTRALVVGAVQHTQRTAQEVTRELMDLTGTPHCSTGALASTARDIGAIGGHLAYSLVTEHRMAAHLYEGRTPMPFMI